MKAGFVSVIIPVYNEQESLPPLMDAIVATMQPLNRRGEVVFVDDGSRARPVDTPTPRVFRESGIHARPPRSGFHSRTRMRAPDRAVDSPHATAPPDTDETRTDNR